MVLIKARPVTNEIDGGKITLLATYGVLTADQLVWDIANADFGFASTVCVYTL